jgi:hypothetical protein
VGGAAGLALVGVLGVLLVRRRRYVGQLAAQQLSGSKSLDASSTAACRYTSTASQQHSAQAYRQLNKLIWGHQSIKEMPALF